MPDGWNAEIYRRRAAQWRQEAQSRPEGKERDACIKLAEGYEHLVEAIELSLGSSQRSAEGERGRSPNN